ncbi:unnamed protein product [Vitrella brassicaformis CCMP3155]|uniref:H(+)-exporting diphosphatase n=2 Tax=Vitrella brassicaformis TaxID=1169539 RepID=A0A0G4GDT2_VITBC|nr:unnamed protein product [Vitrella brassicaformis CCMP3155]|eukprot:CEM27578.1 unnamed protein product [Vitrella brassicaformis CCMP3155]
MPTSALLALPALLAHHVIHAAAACAAASSRAFIPPPSPHLHQRWSPLSATRSDSSPVSEWAVDVPMRPPPSKSIQESLDSWRKRLGGPLKRGRTFVTERVIPERVRRTSKTIADRFYTRIVEDWFPPESKEVADADEAELSGRRALTFSQTIPFGGMFLSLLCLALPFAGPPALAGAVAPTAAAYVAGAAAQIETDAKSAVARSRSFSAAASMAAAESEAAAARAESEAAAVPYAAALAALGSVLAGSLAEAGFVYPNPGVWVGPAISTYAAVRAAVAAVSSFTEAKVARASSLQEMQAAKNTAEANRATAIGILLVVAPVVFSAIIGSDATKGVETAAVAALTAAVASVFAEYAGAVAGRATSAKQIAACKTQAEVAKADASASITPFTSAKASTAAPWAVAMSTVLSPLLAVVYPAVATFYIFFSIEASSKAKSEADIAEEMARADLAELILYERRKMRRQRESVGVEQDEAVEEVDDTQR